MEAEKPETTAVDMELEAGGPPEDGAAAGSVAPNNGTHEPEENGAGKREREDGDEEDEGVKKQKVEKSAEEERLENVEEGDEGEAVEEGDKGEGVEEGDKGEGVEEGNEGKGLEEGNEGKGLEEGVEEGEKDEKVDGAPVKLGPKSFGSSVDMFEYFYKFLHAWSPYLDVSKYEFMVLADLIKKGHPEPDKKIGGGIQAFQVRNHPMWKSRCFFLVRTDGSSDDFSFRKCIDHILPLPDNMKVSDGKKGGGNQKGGGGHGFGGRGGRGRGGGRGGRGKRCGFGK
ncbi:hypothetical protein Taro_018355 [Colocasia esculenta]|uniref:Uncharacterized protein n=1 Tax=Colocasia esculenta TaxID=4460 RepID=A0A843V257_COLES|nr:hypothetical protein [Colocasia esculenta]